MLRNYSWWAWRRCVADLCSFFFGTPIALGGLFNRLPFLKPVTASNSKSFSPGLAVRPLGALSRSAAVFFDAGSAGGTIGYGDSLLSRVLWHLS